MRTRSWLYTAYIGLALLLACPFSTYAQCNLSQGCKPADNLTLNPNGTGQVFVGDGASNNGAGGWTTAYAGSNQCLSCHYD
ncbi:MAG TPA: hypothetical protein VEK84_11655, partial [Terriglobales bacterium]|nr:hypothetical protein [Terriglobales bacterium]